MHHLLSLMGWDIKKVLTSIVLKFSLLIKCHCIFSFSFSFVATKKVSAPGNRKPVQSAAGKELRKFADFTERKKNSHLHTFQ